MKKNYRGSMVVLGVMCLSIGACGGAPKEIKLLEDARSDYNEASQNVTIVKNAPDLLDQARDALEDADRKWKDKDDKWRVEHYAYLAKQRVETARLISERHETDQEIEQMTLDRRTLTLSLREAELVKAREEALDLKRQMAALQAQQTERGMVLTLGDVLFDLGQASLAPGAARNIAKIADFMRSYPERRAVIEGHTDSQGEADYNLNLSRERAFAVRNALENAGIESSRLSTQGFGESLPVASNTTAVGRQKNRRVEIIFPDAGIQISEFDE